MRLPRTAPRHAPTLRTCGESESNPRTRETKYLIAYCADGPEPRATSGQGRAYSAARGRVAHGFISRLWHAQRYTSNNRSALQTIDWPKFGFPCTKSLSIDVRQMSRFMQPAPWTLALHSTRIRSTRVRFGCAAMLNLEIPARNSEQIVIEGVARVCRA